MSGNLPPGVTDRDIDMAAPGYDEPPFYCWRYEVDEDVHCFDDGHVQCRECQQDEPPFYCAVFISGRMHCATHNLPQCRNCEMLEHEPDND